ncbi:MAG: sterol desaturase family protein [Alphaproteobacteria bacterium]|nr:sterol desaturase family protein [Alphaproteobacteria bacterium]
MLDTSFAVSFANSEPALRLACFVGVLVVVAAAEALAPRRARLASRLARWPSNLGLAAVNTFLLRIAFPGAAVGMAASAEAGGFGLLNVTALPFWTAIIVGVVLLDLAIYLQHVIVHAVPLLWRLHRMHHADLDFDVTTGVRFHPVEILLSMVLKIGLVAALGPPIVAVIFFEVLLNATSMFNHSNLRLPAALDRTLRLVVVTPDMHRVHHSVIVSETNSNFGFNLPYWDRLFGTYRAQPAAGHERMTMGLSDFRDPAELRLDRLLLQPLANKPNVIPINRETIA